MKPPSNSLVDEALLGGEPTLIAARTDKQPPAGTTERDPVQIRERFMQGSAFEAGQADNLPLTHGPKRSHGGTLRCDRGWWRRGRSRRCNRGEVHAEASELIRFLGLAGIEDIEAGSLSYGGQRLVDLGIALGSKPQVLLLDEPLAGLAAAERERASSQQDPAPL